MRTSTKELSLYSTWYEFKFELQRRSGLIILNSLWMKIKPRDPLPWYEHQMKEALVRLSTRIQRLSVCPRCGGNLVMDRDIDGYYKRCIQCSFNISIDIQVVIPRKPVEKKLYPWRMNIKQALPCSG